MKTPTSSGLLLLLVGVIALSAFINGALPRLLETLFSADSPATAGKASSIVPAASRPGPTVGGNAVGGVA